MRTLFKLLGGCVAVAFAATTMAAGPQLGIGANFTGSTFNVDSSFVPPDTDGAVGRRHIVELINGHYAVYLKKDGTRVQSASLDQFWTDAGATVRGQLSDPRILFDPFSRRWFASTPSFNFGNGPDDLLLAVSKGTDPTQGWAGFTIPFAGPVGNFVDFPTLGFDRDAVYLFTNGTVLVVPKSDLLAASPSVARAVLVQSRDLLTPDGTKMQPIVSLDNAGLPEPLLGPWDVEGTLCRCWMRRTDSSRSRRTRASATRERYSPNPGSAFPPVRKFSHRASSCEIRSCGACRPWPTRVARRCAGSRSTPVPMRCCRKA